MDNDVTVRGVITREYVGVSESDTVQGTVELMREDQASSAVVLRGSDPVGIVTEWDVLGLVADKADPAETTVEAIMSSPVRTVSAETALVDAAGIMSSEGIRNLVVTDEPTGDIVGVLADRDVIAAVASLQKREGNGQAFGAPTEDLAGTGSTANAGAVVRDHREREAETVAGPNGNGEPDPYVSQGVCEVCGSLTDELRDVNGQLRCGDCQEI